MSHDPPASLLSACVQLTGDLSISARRGRIYLPQVELARFGLSDDEIFDGKVTDKWRSFMKNQIKRARMFFRAAEDGVSELNQASRWLVRSMCFIDFITVIAMNYLPLPDARFGLLCCCISRSSTRSKRMTTTTSRSALLRAKQRS